MPDWLMIFSLTLIAGIAMPAGALIARIERIQRRWLEEEFRHSVIAFGGGALLSAVALVLVPEGARQLHPVAVALFFALGSVSFMALDVLLQSMKSQASQLAAMLSDFIPEALAMGAAFATNDQAGSLLAGLIALQNLPEGFNAYREVVASKQFRPRRVIIGFTLMAFFGPAAGLIGFFMLSSHPAAVGAIMLFAAGGILYLIFQDIAPQVRLKQSWAPPLGATAGFLLGLIGKLVG